MTVTFNRAQLIKVANSAIDAHNQAAVDYADAVGKFKTQQRIKHGEQYRAQIKSLRDFLSASIRHGGVITRDEARKAAGNIGDIEYLFYSGDPADYVIKQNVTVPQGWLSPAELIETRALLSVLEAAEGDTITANELKLLGLKNLAPIFTAAAQDAAQRNGARKR